MRVFVLLNLLLILPGRIFCKSKVSVKPRLTRSLKQVIIHFHFHLCFRVCLDEFIYSVRFFRRAYFNRLFHAHNLFSAYFQKLFRIAYEKHLRAYMNIICFIESVVFGLFCLLQLLSWCLWVLLVQVSSMPSENQLFR